MAEDTGIPFESHLIEAEDGFALRGGEIFRTVINFQTTLVRSRLKLATAEDLTALSDEELVLVESPYIKGLSGTVAILLDKAFTARVVDFMIMGEGDVEFMAEEHLDGIVEAINQLLGNEATELGNQLGLSLRNEVKPARLISPAELAESHAGWLLAEFDVQIEGQESARLIKLLSPELCEKLGEMLGGSGKEDESPQEGLDEDGFPLPRAAGEKPASSNAPLDQSSIDELLAGAGHSRSKPRPRAEEPVKDVKQASFSDFGNVPAKRDQPLDSRLNDSGLARILDLRLPVVIELGRTRMLIKDIVELTPGSVIELNKLVGEPVDLFVNGTRFAQGEVVVIDENFGVRITELIPMEERIKTAEEAS